MVSELRITPKGRDLGRATIHSDVLIRSWTRSKITALLILAAMVFVVLLVSREEIQDASHQKGEELRTTTPIEINPESTVSSDISSIWHNEDHSDICMQLNEGARCPRPSLVGRLSGEAIAILEWRVAHNPTLEIQTGTVYCGSYEKYWLDPGIYFIEVIIIHCHGFGIQALDTIMSNPDHTVEDLRKWRAYDFTHECVEDPARNRLTGNTSFLLIKSMHLGDNIGRWVLMTNGTKPNGSNSTIKPWLTRYQPQECKQNTYKAVCKDTGPADNSRISQFKFEWAGDQQWMKDVENMKVDLGLVPPTEDYRTGMRSPVLLDFRHKIEKYISDGENTDAQYENNIFYGPNKVCLVGDSHSRHLAEAMFRLNLGHRFVVMPFPYPISDPSEREPSGVLHYVGDTNYFKEYYFKRNCTRFVFSIGLHPLCSATMNEFKQKFGGPFLVTKYRKYMLNIVGNEEIYNIGSDITIYLQNIHDMPLGYYMNGCEADGRPLDWRSSTTIDSYNYALQEIVTEM
jgi:hypothetical protein